MPSSEPLRFVVNRHDATTLHFDLRLEVDGVLVSWAVPKGPSLDPKAKRLAVQVDDHDMEHLDFEGRTESEDGRVQTKIVWDTGLYLPAEPPGPALERGHLRFVVSGHKLKGAFALTRTRMGGNERNWILVKIDDEYADRDRDPTVDENESVLSGMTNEDLERDTGRLRRALPNHRLLQLLPRPRQPLGVAPDVGPRAVATGKSAAYGRDRVNWSGFTRRARPT